MSKEQRVRAVTLAVIAVAFVIVAGRQSGWKFTDSGPGGLLTGEPAKDAEPRDTIYRMLDAAREGDVEAYLACYSGQMERMLRQSREEMTPAGFAKYLAERNREMKGIAISEPVEQSGNEVRVQVEYVYEDRNEVQQFHLEKRDETWKIVRVDSAQRVKTLVPYGTPVY